MLDSLSGSGVASSAALARDFGLDLPKCFTLDFGRGGAITGMEPEVLDGGIVKALWS